MGSTCSCDVGNKYCLYNFGEKYLGTGSFGRLLKRKDDDDDDDGGGGYYDDDDDDDDDDKLCMRKYSSL